MLQKYSLLIREFKDMLAMFAGIWLILMFMYYLILGYSFNDFLSLFKNNNYVYNDKLACDFIKNNYPYAAHICT